MSTPSLIPLDEAGFHPRLAATPGLALVLFGGPDGGAGRVAEARLPEAAPAGATLFKVDVQRATALARAFDVFHLPDLRLYKDGHYHARLACEISPASLAAALARALALPAEEEP